MRLDTVTEALKKQSFHATSARGPQVILSDFDKTLSKYPFAHVTNTLVPEAKSVPKLRPSENVPHPLTTT